MRLDEFVRHYANHPETKSAGPDGMPATEETCGVLGRLHLRSGEPSRIGKEVDRLDEDDGATLELEEPLQYVDAENEYQRAIVTIGQLPRKESAKLLNISVRRLQDILQGRSKPRAELRERIRRLGRALSEHE
jgi:hypothetical protein